jgi:hypothetical protein
MTILGRVIIANDEMCGVGCEIVLVNAAQLDDLLCDFGLDHWQCISQCNGPSQLEVTTSETYTALWWYACAADHYILERLSWVDWIRLWLRLRLWLWNNGWLWFRPRCRNDESLWLRRPQWIRSRRRVRCLQILHVAII